MPRRRGPSPEGVLEAMANCLRDVGASSGRSAHRFAQDAESIRLDAREAVAALFGVSNPMRVVFTLNATTAINMVLHGLLPPGSHVVTSSMEHNAVAPAARGSAAARRLCQRGSCQRDGLLDPEAIAEHLRDRYATGCSEPRFECLRNRPADPRDRPAGPRARRPLCLSMPPRPAAASRSRWRRTASTLLAFSGHKGLLGPAGTGGLAISRDFDEACLPAFIQGGPAAARSRRFTRTFCPTSTKPERQTSWGWRGLATSVRFVLNRGVEEIGEHERLLTQRLIDGLQSIAGVRVFRHGRCESTDGSARPSRSTAVRSPMLPRRLTSDSGFCAEPGLHCAPQAHRTLGTFPHGASLRFAPGLSRRSPKWRRRLTLLHRSQEPPPVADFAVILVHSTSHASAPSGRWGGPAWTPGWFQRRGTLSSDCGMAVKIAAGAETAARQALETAGLPFDRIEPVDQ